tara:strand:+ start:2041 stop:2466 length:426 start_codon:yes stop_codon:yes gene_type:complete
MTKDIELYESGDGGELSILNGDVSLIETLYQTIYIALFGGMADGTDYWANNLLFATKKSKQYVSETEKLLNEVTLNSSGRLKIARAVENDLSFIKSIANYEVNVLILSTNRIEIDILLSSGTELQYIWDNAKNEVIINKTI